MIMTTCRQCLRANDEVTVTKAKNSQGGAAGAEFLSNTPTCHCNLVMIVVLASATIVHVRKLSGTGHFYQVSRKRRTLINGSDYSKHYIER